ncbi:MAG: hypothetical protein J6S67_05790 [Methanobrevibacter sp.]|nr:hypothetical protein [Methanobrevibacter sp.]
MKNNPKYAKVGDRKYKINTSYKVALKCNEIVLDNSISDYEKMLAIIYLLFGEEGLEYRPNYDALLDIAYKYLSCEEEKETSNDKPDMSFGQDFGLIKASFKSDYGIDLSKEDLDWYDFYMYLNGLTENCILNRVRSIRTYDASKIEDNKDRQEFIKTQKRFALKREEPKLTEEQIKSMEELNNILGI